MAADFNIRQFSRIWQTRVFEGLNVKASSVPANSLYKEPLLGFVNQASITRGSGTSQFTLIAGKDVPGLPGLNLTLTLTAGASLVVSQIGFDISIQFVSGTTTAAALVAAVNAFFTGTAAQFVQAFLTAGNSGAGTTIAALPKTNFTANQRIP